MPQQAPDLKPAISPDTAKTDAKNEQPSKIEDAKTEPAKTEPAKPEAAKPEAAKTELPRTEPAKVEASKTETAKPEPAKPDLAKLDQPKPPQPAADETLKSLQSELEALKAEHAALEADRAAQAQGEAQGQAVPHAPVDPGLGPLPDSFQAVALPPTGAAAEEAVSYQQIVFSQLAKAKERSASGRVCPAALACTSRLMRRASSLKWRSSTRAASLRSTRRPSRSCVRPRHSRRRHKARSAASTPT